MNNNVRLHLQELPLRLAYSDSYQLNNYPIIGTSEAISRVKKQIFFAGNFNLVTFISGESGCEKKSIAYHIHQSSKYKKGNFITISSNISCIKYYKECLLKSLYLAQNGTLYIENIDTLPDDKKDHIISLFTLENFNQNLISKNINLIISLKEENNSFIDEMIAPSIPHFCINIPPLRERHEDIDDHINFIISYLKLNIKITDPAQKILREYQWPENIKELHKAILFLASCYEGNITEKEIEILKLSTSSKKIKKDTIINMILNKETDPFKDINSRLHKSISFISLNFLDEITLQDIAKSSYTSTSHQSYLFRKYLNMSFKTLLNQVRIHFSKRLIEKKPSESITNICMMCGFRDLSHFEKMFKRFIGCTPRQYRKGIKNEKEKSHLN